MLGSQELEGLCNSFISKSYVSQGVQELRSCSKDLKTLLSQRGMPKQGWSEAMIERLLSVRFSIPDFLCRRITVSALSVFRARSKLQSARQDLSGQYLRPSCESSGVRPSNTLISAIFLVYGPMCAGPGSYGQQ